MGRLRARLMSAIRLPGAAFADPATECGGSSRVEIGARVAETPERVDQMVDIFLRVTMASAEELAGITGRSKAVPALEAAQTAWSACRDAPSAHVGARFGGGSGTAIAINSWPIELGRDRAEEVLRPVQ